MNIIRFLFLVLFAIGVLFILAGAFKFIQEKRDLTEDQMWYFKRGALMVASGIAGATFA